VGLSVKRVFSFTYISGMNSSMMKILFVCHGNICRSPMAEFVFKDMVAKAGLSSSFEIASAATSNEEIGNPVYPPVRQLLSEKGISCKGKSARRITADDYGYYDYLIGMDDYNIRNMKRCFGGDEENKIFKLLSFAGLERDVDDPWYTGEFDACYKDVVMGCEALLRSMENGTR